MPKKHPDHTGLSLILEVVEDITHAVVGQQQAVAGRLFKHLRYPHRIGSPIGFLLWRGVVRNDRLTEVKRRLHERPPPPLGILLSMRAMSIIGSSVVWRAHLDASVEELGQVIQFLKWWWETLAALNKMAELEPTKLLNAALPHTMVSEALETIQGQLDPQPNLFSQDPEPVTIASIRPPLIIPIAEFPDVGMAREAGAEITTAKTKRYTPKGVALVEVRPGNGRIYGVLAPVPFAK